MYRILIVDDETVILEGLKEAIEESDLPFSEIGTAGSADEALRLFEASPFDILLSDISMPQMNGLTMAQEMKKIWPQTEVVFLTGFHDFEYAVSALRLHSFDYLLKPVSDEELVKRLGAVIAVLDGRLKDRFVYDTDEILLAGQKSRELAAELSRQMFRKRPDFGALKACGFPFDRERLLRILVIRYQADHTRIDPQILHNWMQEILPKLTYGYGYACGFSAASGNVGEEEERMPGTDCCSVFLIQKSAASEALFSGVYRALEEMQGYFLTKLDLNMTIAVSHRCTWETWMDLAGRMLAQLSASRQYGALYTYEENPEPEEDGNLLMYRIGEYIDSNPGEDLSLGRLARQFHINPSYLSRSFHQTMQKPLSLYIAQARIGEARRLLEETDEKIYGIAQKVGFDTQGYFTKVFNKMVGMSPKEYRISKREAEVPK